ncbi:hypothetical protein ACFUOZ_21295, partial [Paenarthrobacter sp. NPDC057355]|uniref:hypothetical protein n=1 Tax=Paenarthrobacter sp. NPDC057355 TaxID=3346105 RepID=UPI00363AFEBD
IFKDGKLAVERTTVTGGTITFNETHIKPPTTAGNYNITITYTDPGQYTYPTLTKNNETPRPIDFPGTTKGTTKTITTTLKLDQTTRKLTIDLRKTPTLKIDKITINPTPNP